MVLIECLRRCSILAICMQSENVQLALSEIADYATCNRANGDADVAIIIGTGVVAIENAVEPRGLRQ